MAISLLLAGITYADAPPADRHRDTVGDPQGHSQSTVVVKTPVFGTPTFALKQSPTATRTTRPASTRDPAAPSPTNTYGLGQPVVISSGLIEDTFVNAWSPEQNYGAQGDLKLRFAASGTVKSILLRFDTSAIAEDTTIESATLRLHTIEQPRSPLTIGAYAMLSDWREHEATWIFASTGVSWAQSGAMGVGHDRTSAPVGIARVDGVSESYDWDITGLVQHWVSGGYSDDPALAGVTDNHGLGPGA